MKKLAGIAVILATVCLLIAILLKLTTAGKIIPGPLPVNWARLTDTFLLFAIALSLLK